MRARPAAERLGRLPSHLAVLCAALASVGLIVLAWLAIVADDDRTTAGLDDADRTVTSVVLRLVNYDTTLVPAYVTQDPVNDECPQFAILQGAAGHFASYYSSRSCVRMDPAYLGGLADDAAVTAMVRTGQAYATDGEPVRVRAEPFRNKAGQFIGAVVAVADAGPAESAHVRFALLVVGGCVVLVGGVATGGYLAAARALRPAAAALEQQEILLAETAHDLRNPVAALRALAETSISNPSQQAELLPRTLELACRMGTIIDGQLVRARLAAGVAQLVIEPVWLDQLVNGVVEQTDTNGAQVTVTAAPSLAKVDPSLVTRAIGNLLDNALRYGRHPGQDAVVHITVAANRVTVADHGPGVDVTIADDVLDRFRTGSGSSGLGLSIVSWVAQVHGGTLNVYNADEGGAIFELVLPTA